MLLVKDGILCSEFEGRQIQRIEIRLGKNLQHQFNSARVDIEDEIEKIMLPYSDKEDTNIYELISYPIKEYWLIK